MSLTPNPRASRAVLLHVARATLCVLAASLTWAAGAGTAGAVLAGGLVAFALQIQPRRR